MARLFAIFGIAVVVLLAAALLFLHTSPARRFVLSQVTRLLQQERISFNTDELSYNLLGLRLALRNVEIRSAEAPDLPPLARIDRLTADVSLTALLRRRYVLQSGDAEGVTIHYFVDERGRDNLPRPPHDPEQPSEPLDYLIDQLRVRNANVRYEDRARLVDIAVPVSSLEVDGNVLTDRHAVRLQAAKGTLVVGDREARLDALAAALDLGEDDARFETVDVTADGVTLNVTGTITQFGDPHGDLRVRGRLDAARAATLAGLREPLTGLAEIDANVKGRLAAPVIDGRVKVAKASFRNLTDVQLDASAAYDMTRKRATFSTFDLRAPFGHVTGHGTLVLAGDDRSQATATVSGLDAARLMRAFDLRYVVASRVDAQVQAEWPGVDYLQASGNATATLTPTATRVTRSVIPAGGRIELKGRANALDAVLTRVHVAGADVNGRVRLVEQRTIDGTAGVRIADVGRTVAAAEALLGRGAGTLLPVDVGGALSATARLSGSLSSPTVAAEFDAPSLTAGAASGIALDGGLTYTPARLTVRRLDLQWQEARAHLAGGVGLGGTRPLDLDFTADTLQVADLLRAMERTDLPASGTLTLQGHLGGTAAQPTVAAIVNGADLVAYEETWGTLVARVNMAAREVVVTELAIDKPQPQGNGRITGTAAYHLDRRTYSADLRSDNLQLLGLMLPDGRTIRGSVELTARGSGSVDDPAGSVTLTASELNVDQYAIGGVNAQATLANRQATVTAAVPTYAVTADARIGTESPYPATVKARIDNLQLATLPLNLQTPLDGQLRATVEASAHLGGEGAIADALQATATIESFAGSWNTQPFVVDAPAVLRYARQRLAIDQLRLRAQDSSVAVSGELPLTDQGSAGALTVDAHANLATLARYAPADMKVTASGDLTLRGLVRGTLKAIDPDLTLVVNQGAIATPDLLPGLSNLDVRTRVVDGEANIEQLTGNWGVARITAAGRVPLEALPALPVEIPRRGGPATFTATIQNLDVAQLPGAPENLTGRISVEAKMAATRADLMALEGHVTFPELELAISGLTLAQQQPSTIRLAQGIARVDQFTLTGSVGTITTTGTIGLTGDRPIDVNTEGNLNVAAISLFTDVVRAEGETTLKIAARGTMAAPELNGVVNLADAMFVVDEPTIAAEDVTARLDLSGRRVSLSELTGILNGGALKGSGFIELGAGGIADAALEVVTDDVAFDAPLDLRSISDATVRLTKRNDEFVVDGQVTIDEAGLTGDINFDEGLLAALQSRRRLDLTEQRHPFLERVRFNLDIDTATPVIVDNNLARAEVVADLRLLGSPYQPGLSGRLTVTEESEITLNERRYQVERGVITFIDERRIVPTFDLLLNTTTRTYDITIAVTGTPGDTETTLTSDPALPEPDIMSLLVTGRTLEEMRGEEFDVAREQMLSYLSGRVGSELGRGLQRATGLSTVRIEPQLIANETDPSARLTVGQELTDDLEVVYSTNLTDSNDQIWIVEYDVTRRFQSRGVRQSDNSYRFDIRHDVRIGGRPAPRRLPRQRPTIGAVQVAGDGRVPAAELTQLLDMSAGDRYDFFAARDAVEDVEDALEQRGRLQARVRLQRQVEADMVDVTLRVLAGPRVDLQFNGLTPPRKVIDEVRTKWRRGVFDTQRIDDSVDVLRGWLMADNYLQAQITGSVEEAGPDLRLARFEIVPGPRFSRVVLAFEGASGIPADDLDTIINEQDLEQPLFTDPTQVTELLERYYHEQGYLVAEIDAPRYEFAGAVARVVLPINEGPLFLVREVSATGTHVIPATTLVGELPVQNGDPFRLFAAENALDHIRDVYWARGYNDVRSDYELVLDRAAGRVDVRFSVSEGPQSVIAAIEVQGNEKTSDRLVREQLELQPAQPLDLGALARSRRNLYDTRAFSVVDITRDAETAQGEQKPVRLNVSVREVQPIQLRYGLSYDTERGLGGIFDVSNHNSLGKARVLGLHTRYDGEVREVRGSLTQPSLRYWPVETTGSVYYRVERNRAIDDTDARYDIDRRGASIQQERRLGDAYVWSWGFRYERAHTIDPRPGGTLDQVVTVTPLTTTFTRETRDEVLDATRGAFWSQAFSYSPSWLGSDEAFIRYFGQYFHYFPLQRERRERFTNEILRPRMVYAVGVRIGLARGSEGVLPTSERFFAGGSSSIRGFAQNAAGPVDPRGLPLGGDALIVINNELRMPLMGMFDGVVFSDMGNVFPRVSDFSFSDLRETAGVGLRARTRWFLLRGDYGILLDRRAGERRARFYFSIGQAF